MLADMTIGWDHVATVLAGWIAINIISGVLTLRMASAVHAKQIEELRKSVDRVDEAIAGQISRTERNEAAIAANRQDRIACERDAARTYAPREEVMRILAESIRGREAIAGQIEQVHNRITEVARQVSQMAGEMAAEKRAAQGPPRVGT